MSFYPSFFNLYPLSLSITHVYNQYPLSFYHSSPHYSSSTSFYHSPYHRQVLLLYLFLLLPEKSNKASNLVNAFNLQNFSVAKTKSQNWRLSQTYIFVVVGDDSCRPSLVSPPSPGKGRWLSPPIFVSFTIRIWK